MGKKLTLSKKEWLGVNEQTQYIQNVEPIQWHPIDTFQSFSCMVVSFVDDGPVFQFQFLVRVRYIKIFMIKPWKYFSFSFSIKWWNFSEHQRPQKGMYLQWSYEV